MSWILHHLLYLLACVYKREMAWQIYYLKVGNEVLRQQLPERVGVTASDRKRLIKAGKGLGTAIRELVSIIQPETLLR